ncbi:MAG: type III secretion system chaperone [Verrucomicrobia bacterium]|nr:type III secretion system chaperone [Verrucomicrobiota bacterium]
MLNRFIEQITKEMNLKLSKESGVPGFYELNFEPQIKVSIHENKEGIIKLQSYLASLPQEKLDEYLLFVMSANLFGQETGKNYLGLDRDEKRVTLNRLLEKEIEYAEFKLALEEFLNYCETWRADTKAYVG